MELAYYFVTNSPDCNSIVVADRGLQLNAQDPLIFYIMYVVIMYGLNVMSTACRCAFVGNVMILPLKWV
jgi:hypothetical protein